MAATLTPGNELTYLSFPITKTETNADGDVIVYGKATDGSVDSDEQIVDTDWSGKAIADWLASGANVRVQHNAQRDPAGVGIEVNTGADGETWVKSLVVEPVAKTLVLKKALRAYSVGIARPKIVRDAVARGGRIVDGEIVEISLVDRPANKNCGVQLVKSDKDGNAEWVGKMFGNSELLTKSAAVEETVTMAANATFSPADLAKLLAHRETAEKRQMDPNVGGGVDRDKIPSGDFAGRDRSFPIVTPGDVSDAASSIGRAGADNYSSDELKSRIIAIARRKGEAFVAALPESWKKAVDVDVVKAADEDVDTEDDGNDETNEAKPDATKAKGAKSCKGCGAGYDADSKLRKCEKCGAKLPMAKGSTADAVKKDKVVCPGCGANIHTKHSFCPECGKKIPSDAKSATKNHKFTCLGCEKNLDKGEKFCPGCGKENPGYLPQADAQLKVQKSSKPTPSDDAVGAGDVKPVPEHREPDGPAIESLEHDMHVPTVPDSETQLKAATRLKAAGVTQDMGALHDMLCAAFSVDDVSKAHPGATLADLDAAVWQAKASDAVYGASVAEASKALQMWQNAELIKGVDQEILNEIRGEAHKSFMDANPGPGAYPTPTELKPGSFNRPLIVAGHEAPSPGHDGPIMAKVPTEHIEAAQFQRGPLTSDHAADSPGNKGMSRTYYRNTQRDVARSAMQAMHDHIAQTFPDLCAMSGPGVGGAPAEGMRPVPDGVGKSESDVTVQTPVADESRELTLAKAAKLRAKLGQAPEVTEVAQPEAEVTKAAAVTEPAEDVHKMLSDLREELGVKLDVVTKALKDERERTNALQVSLDALGNMPDPNVVAFRGIASDAALNKSSSSPAGVTTVAETAERTQLALMRALTEEARNNPNPGQREAAWAKLYQMNGLA